MESKDKSLKKDLKKNKTAENKSISKKEKEQVENNLKSKNQEVLLGDKESNLAKKVESEAKELEEGVDDQVLDEAIEAEFGENDEAKLGLVGSKDDGDGDGDGDEDEDDDTDQEFEEFLQGINHFIIMCQKSLQLNA